MNYFHMVNRVILRAMAVESCVKKKYSLRREEKINFLSAIFSESSDRKEKHSRLLNKLRVIKF